MKNAILLYLKSLSNKQAHLIKGPVITYCPKLNDFRMESLDFKD